VAVVLRFKLSDAPEVKRALRDEVLFRGGFPPWEEWTEGEWFHVSADRVELARTLYRAGRPWLVGWRIA
jgi:hypothetical protein